MIAVSFNVNSIRTRMHQLEEVVEKHRPDFIGLQETKVNDPDFPLESINALGYDVEYFGQKTHYGVALLSRYPFKKVIKGFPGDSDDAQRRFIGGVFDTPLGEITVLNGYFPQGESRDHAVKFPAKRKFYADLLQYLTTAENPEKHIIVMGDMNISHQDLDIGIGEENRKRWLRTGKCSFLPEEREWLNDLLAWGLKDSYREKNPDCNGFFSWFDYRSGGFEDTPKRGLRIDLILMTKSLLDKCVDTGIDYDIRGMEKPSDHCPIWVELK
ncbi:exodeoxyribonuclease III [Cellvibrio sp. pealriver]|uniref:exodeoxyribonuclease III n=1 Tax=Cellvibrio sp. pealriver TaxID=1622269 RepID=UPI00066FB6D0|nr:exodeoxyribonuclease III [Cellvibrio sp. pealriver]